MICFSFRAPDDYFYHSTSDDDDDDGEIDNVSPVNLADDAPIESKK
jgi:hypothetical protein